MKPRTRIVLVLIVMYLAGVWNGRAESWWVSVAVCVVAFFAAYVALTTLKRAARDESHSDLRGS